MKPPMKPHSKPPANHLQTAFHAVRHALFSLLFTLFSLHSSASVPLAWQVTPRNPAPVAFDRHHGETLEFRCVFSGFGDLPFGQAADIRLWYQTNGMDTAWWSVPASVSSNVLSATFPPQADPGADRLSLFFGAPSNAYSSAVLRLRHSPGFAPNILPPPYVTIWAEELAAIRALIDYSASNADLVATIRATAPAPGNYAAVSNTAMSAVQQNDLDDFYNDLETGHKPVSWAYKANGLEDYGSGDSLGAAEILDLLASAITTNDVCNIATNEVATGWSKWAWTDGGDWGTPYYDDGVGEWLCDSMNGAVEGTTDINATSITYFLWDAELEQDLYHTATRTRLTRNSLGLARLTDLPPLTNGLASATSVSAANARASNAQNMAVAASNTAASVAGTVAAWETYWDGDEVRVTVTNYDSAVHLPSLYIEQKLENTNAYRTVWDERTRWDSNDVQMAEMRSAIDEKADRAWGYYDSHTGNYAPDGYTWLSSPRIAIAGGLAYQRTLTTSGAVWVLSSNGMVAQTGGTEDGFFRIKDDEGNTTFEIVRGNKRTVGATAAGIKVTSPRNSPTTTIEIPYNVTSDVPPTLYGTVSLSSPEWAEISATWTGQSGAWTGTVATSTSTYFIKGTYETGGETYIKNVAPISVESGIYCTDGIHKVRPVYTNGTITWEVVQ